MARYRREWEEMKEFKDWVQKKEVDGEVKAFCEFCQSIMRAHLADLKKHAKSKKHEDLAKAAATGSSGDAGGSVARRYYQKKWERLPECAGWLTGAGQTAKCNVCKKELSVRLSDIRKHAETAKHVTMMKVTAGGKIPMVGDLRKKRKYRPEWESLEECQGWLVQSPAAGDGSGGSGASGARCKWCNVELMAHLFDLKKHAKSKKHVAMGRVRRLQEETDEQAGKPIRPWELQETKKRELELRVALHSAVDSHFNGVDELCEIIHDKLGDAFRMTGQESQALLELVLGPHFKNLLKEDLEDAPFSLVLDQPDRITTESQVTVCICYFSPTHNEMVTTYLGAVAVGQGQSPARLAQSLLDLLAEWNLDAQNLVGLLSDGIEELCVDSDGVGDESATLSAQLSQACPHVFHLRSSFESVARSVDHAVKQSLPSSACYLLRQTYNWFAGSPRRQMQHRPFLQQAGLLCPTPKQVIESGDDDDLSISQIRPVPSDSTQWLHIADYSAGLVVNYDAMRAHFNKVKTDCHEAQLLYDVYGDSKLRLYLTALEPVLTELARVKSLFQIFSQTPEKTCDNLAESFLIWANQILRPEVISQSGSAERLCDIPLDQDPSPLLDVDQVNFGAPFDLLLTASSLAEEEQLEVKKTCRLLLKHLLAGMQAILKDTLAIMRAAEHFQLPNFLEKPMQREHLVAPFFSQTEEELDSAENKYKLLKMLDWRNRTNTRLFWLEIHNFGDATGNFPLRDLSKGALKMLCLPVFNYEVGRTFKEIHALRADANHRRLGPGLQEAMIFCKFGLSKFGAKSPEFKPPVEFLRN